MSNSVFLVFQEMAMNKIRNYLNLEPGFFRKFDMQMAVILEGSSLLNDCRVNLHFFHFQK